jgi:hypothetical protein
MGMAIIPNQITLRWLPQASQRNADINRRSVIVGRRASANAASRARMETKKTVLAMPRGAGGCHSLTNPWIDGSASSLRTYPKIPRPLGLIKVAANVPAAAR